MRRWNHGPPRTTRPAVQRGVVTLAAAAIAIATGEGDAAAGRQLGAAAMALASETGATPFEAAAGAHAQEWARLWNRSWVWVRAERYFD